ncbi:hypothetical protein MRX60_12555 (plasmid) [Xylella fastidiosa subsp. pauca]|uniref:hypothetical protein n=1 Tax=Xylella fastidiosa TaxID=2371 RepID=UPI00241C49B2|nr:hypothetical protein [Xylella fastidiosa]MDG5826865.1 hypothetical protein [Xylella fastidiosa subsp. pauca]
MTATIDAKRERHSARAGLVEEHPYSVHLTPTAIQTENRDYLMVLRLTGASFERRR